MRSRSLAMLLKMPLMLALVVLSGCAHSIVIVPNIEALIRTPSEAPFIPLHVGYFIPENLRETEITSPGGGGDNIRYFPYNDIEVGFQRMLANVFSSVIKLSAADDMSREGVDCVIVPDIVTNSGGSGLFTWPPTSFTVDLTSNVNDKTGKVMMTTRVVGTGTAETGERISDHAIAGKRAMTDALLKMQTVLLAATYPGVATNVPKVQPLPAIVGTTADRLARVRELLDKGLISQAEYDAKRLEILQTL